ncbi:MAG: tRNA pseudouridine(55) synthase TruB [Eubacteriaceae bacterium]|jgi:tRNA pseudouridine55 synthase|nr:tRNA pseudouridine(55) synthase TruB [Eubacteriaceae bacterium]
MDGLIALNKPSGMTSFQAVGKVRRAVGEKKAGHCGTLDPFAEGVLLILVGRATRLAEDLAAQGKEYLAEVQFGLMTDTLDVWGKELEREGPKLFSRESLCSALTLFIGKQDQIPPAYSAIKKGGVPLYRYARAGIEVKLEPRSVEITEISLVSENLPHSAAFRVSCSKGTYIRSLCRDIAASLGTIGVMSSLTRIKSGDFSIENSHTLEEVESAAQDGRIQDLAVDCLSLLPQLPKLALTKEMHDKILKGAEIDAPEADGIANGSKLCLVYGGRLAAIASKKNGRIHAQKVLGL